MTTPQAILCDLDDTILDDAGSVVSGWRAACRQAAEQVQGLGAEALFTAIQYTRDWFWSNPDRARQGLTDLRTARSQIVHESLLHVGFDLPDVAKRIAHSYRNLREAAVHPFPGAVEALARMRSLGIRLGLITNGSASDQRAKIDRFDLARYFDYILIEREFGAGKPEPQVYTAAMEALHSRPSETWCVGDNLEWEVAAPQRLGIHIIWIDPSHQGLPGGTAVTPDRIIHSLGELV